MSILSLLLMVNVGVAYCRLISYYDDAASLQPILTHSQERRICTELCMSGLGGEPCGDDCPDLAPQGLPIQSPSVNKSEQSTSSDAAGVVASPRSDVCPVLCKNRLGYPLCNCDTDQTKATSYFKVNFQQICSMYCSSYNYKLYGCQDCRLYIHEDGTSNINNGDFKLASMKKYKIDYTKIDWNAWCRSKCRVGEGGVACNCDLLPMAF